MKNNREYVKSDKLILMNFSQRYCKTQAELLNSACFADVWSSFVDHAYKTSMTEITEILEISKNPKKEFIALFKILLTFDV